MQVRRCSASSASPFVPLHEAPTAAAVSVTLQHTTTRATSHYEGQYEEQIKQKLDKTPAHGDGLSNIESWIFGAERFGDKAHEAAADFLKNAAT